MFCLKHSIQGRLSRESFYQTVRFLSASDCLHKRVSTTYAYTPFKRQVPVIFLATFIAIWLIALSALLRLHSTAPLNGPVSLSGDRDLFAVRKIDDPGKQPAQAL
jgi:hypothetical protein